MFSTVLSATLKGLCVEFIHVEADVSNGLPIFQMVGYLSSEVKEAGERVRTAMKNSGFPLPAKRILINLSPADMRKRGTRFDLPIAIALLAAQDEIPKEVLEDILFIGELSLDGRIRHVSGVLPIVLEAKKVGCKLCVVPREDEKEGALVEGISVIGVETLNELCQRLKKGNFETQAAPENRWSNHSHMNHLDFRDVHGQQFAKRAAEIAVAGKHNLLMIGPPGAGKSMLAKRIPSILPPLTREESMELTMLYSIISGLDEEEPLMQQRPFREVHQTVTKAALLGGGMYPRPGEISLAHKGVLFLDEIAEFPRSILELLRQPLEERKIRILREKGEYCFPADCMLVAAMNPCPCGNYPDLNRCTCTTPQIRAYLGRLSQPLLDRIDLCVEVEKVQYQDLQQKTVGEDSAAIRARVCAARQRQTERYQGRKFSANAELGVQEAEQMCKLRQAENRLMERAFERLHMTARTYYKTLLVARTIADLEGEENIEGEHLQEALAYRQIQKMQVGGDAI
ncbi:MAG: YifB family Mg chelatase-like AAA ATPase [Faecalimonas sp.]|nr:YifB family Mg chelatase-like AAA ATPase [Faecalimonas sp.]